MDKPRADHEVADFIGANTDGEALLAFRPSAAALRRAWTLVDREKTHGLTADESAELDAYVAIEHVMRMAKARARSLRGDGAV